MNAKQQVLTLFPLDKDKGYFCECCGLFVKRYHRAMNSNMALAMIILYNNPNKGFVHLEKLMQEKGYQRCGDASYLIHWKFLERKPENRKDGSPRNGYYRLTGLGCMFVESKITAREKIMIFNNKFEGFSGGEVTIQESLGRKFNFNQLMGYNITENGFTTSTTNSDTFSLTPTAILYDGSWDDTIDLKH